RELVALIRSRGAKAVIPPRSCQRPRRYDKARYRLRNRIERCFSKLKQFRRIATRFDRKPTHFLAFLYLTSIPMWLKWMSIQPSTVVRREKQRRPKRRRYWMIIGQKWQNCRQRLP
ncbi:transposase, partial [uncultured Xanthomonas sp.]|uniref:transposase n=1 Tax=uncultured Xanthomonas sp. TaxID=152831 RepID=UPI0025E11325